MELRDEKIINASRERVYAALNDPDVLRQCIPGCKSLEKVDDTHLDAVASLKVGPVKATFDGHVELTDLNPPESYSIVGEGKGGVAGFAKGRADVTLVEEAPETTRLVYDAKAEVGGKLAQLGSRLIDSTAKKLANDFFTKFKAVVEGPPAAEAAEGAPAAEPVAEAAPEAAPAPAPEPAPAAPEPAAAAAPAADPQPASAMPGSDTAHAPTPQAPQQPAQQTQPAAGEGSGGLPWRWIAAGIGAVIIVLLLLDVF